MKKKWLSLTLAAALALTACGGSKPGTSGNSESGGKTKVEDKDITVTYSTDLDSMDYVTTPLQTNHRVNANLVDGLVENDPYGKIVPCLAESWEHNADYTEWTFKIRQGVKWVTNQGEEYGELKAQDFVTGVRHGTEFDSGTKWLLLGVIKGYEAYCASDFSDAEWDKVGVKAVDDYTVKYTMEKPIPYFDSMTTYTVLFPVNKDFLESKGEGCKLGSPDKKKCEFGAVKLDSILYNGGFILTENTAKSQRVMTKNDSYWDKDNVHISKVTEVYDDGKDVYSVAKGFDQGVYSQFSLNPSWKDYDDYKKKYEGKTHYQMPNSTTFGVVWNYNRQVFNETNYAKDEAMKKNTRVAVMNENFRKAVRAAFDVVAYNEISAPHDLAVAQLRNINNSPDMGTKSDGTMYFDLVTKAYNEATGEKRDLNDGKTPFFSKEECAKYLAEAEKEGVKFPVHLDMLVIETSERLTKQAQSMKKSIEANTDGKVIVELVMRDENTVTSIVYTNEDPKAMDYDISTFTGWGADYKDPKTYVDIYSATTGYYMQATGLGQITLNDKKEEVVENEDIKEKIGLMEYEKLYRAADAITDDMDARYEAFAKADAYLIERCIFIPTTQKARMEVVTKLEPFTRPYASYGSSEEKYKGLIIRDDIVTSEEYEKAYEIYQKGGK